MLSELWIHVFFFPLRHLNNSRRRLQSECTVSNKVDLCIRMWLILLETNLLERVTFFFFFYTFYIPNAKLTAFWFVVSPFSTVMSLMTVVQLWGMNAERLIIKVKALLLILSLLFAHQSHEETPRFLSSIIKSSHAPEVSAYSSWCLPLWTLQFLPGFFPVFFWVFPLCTVRYWVFFFSTRCIHCSLNEVTFTWFTSLGILCKQLGLQGKKSQFDLLLQGICAPLLSFWVIYMRPALTKTSFTVPMICTLLPQNDCIWTSLYFMVGKD